MDRTIVSRSLRAAAAWALLVLPSSAAAQAERRVPDAAAMPAVTIPVGTVTEQSPSVDLRAVGKQVAKGIFEVDPGAIVGKRLSVPRGDPAMRSVCLGVYKKGQCVGILIILN